jgi:uncharacterized protein YsxB (DUF464 family)
LISVTILRGSDSSIRGFEVSGHAGYAQHGHDIVCSAVSALCIATANGLEKHSTSPVHIEAAEGGVRVISERTGSGAAGIDNSSAVLYDTLIEALKAIDREYPGRIRFIDDVIDP